MMQQETADNITVIVLGITMIVMAYFTLFEHVPERQAIRLCGVTIGACGLGLYKSIAWRLAFGLTLVVNLILIAFDIGYFIQ